MQIVIVGGGKTGRYLAGRLIDDGASVTVIEKRDEAAKSVQRHCPGCTVVTGNASDPAVLQRAGIRMADALAAVTGKDETNLVVSMLAKMEFSVGRVVARVNNPANEWMFVPKNGVDVGVNHAELAARFVIEGIDASDVYTLMRLGRDGCALVQAKVGARSKAAGHAIKDIAFPPETVVVAVRRGETMRIPNGSTVLEEGDEAVLFTGAQGRDEIRRLLS